MKALSLPTVARLIMLLTLIGLMPWNATSYQDFGARALIAILVAIVVFLLIRYGLAIFVRKLPKASRDVATWPALKEKGSDFRVLPLLRLSAIGALLIGIGAITLENLHALRPTVAFFGSLCSQQILLIVVELLVIRRVLGTDKLSAFNSALVGLMILSILFAWSSNVIIYGQTPVASSILSDRLNLLFAIPAVIIGLTGILRKTLSAKS